MQKDRAGEPFGTQMPAPETSFFAAAATVAAMPEVEERAEGWRQLSTLLVGMPDEFRAAAYRSHPELQNARPYPDTDLSAGEPDLVSFLEQSDLEAIDQAHAHLRVLCRRRQPHFAEAHEINVPPRQQRSAFNKHRDTTNVESKWYRRKLGFQADHRTADDTRYRSP